MKNINNIAIIAIVLVLFAFGCAQSGAGTQYICPDGKTIVANISSCPGAAALTAGGPAVSTSQSCQITLEKEIEVCYGMPTAKQQSLEEICILGLAAKHQNTSLCKRLSYDKRRDCYPAVAVAANNADLCVEAGQDKDNCYQQYATESQDATVCEKIKDVNYKDSCYQGLANTLSDATLCEQIKLAPQKDSCYYSMAMRFQDSTYCNKITNENQKQNCLQSFQHMSSQPQPPKPA